MRRLFLIPFISALIGGGVVVAIVAAAGGLGYRREQTVTIVQAAPIAPSNASQQSSGLTPHEIYERDAPGRRLRDLDDRAENRIAVRTCSAAAKRSVRGRRPARAFVIDANGTILTNYHVVENAIKVTVSFEKGKTVAAQVVGKDPSNDLAVLHIPPDGLTLHPLTLGDSSTVQVGDPVLAIGNPFDLDRTLTTGVVSALQRQITAPNGFTIDNVIQTDAPINPGNSGGPLLNARGRVIGINSQIETGGSGDGSVGIGFAIPINTAKAEIPQLEKGGTVRGAYLGVDIADDRRLARGAQPAGQEAARSCRACRRARPPKRPASAAARSTAASKTAGRGRRRHHRLDRRQGGQRAPKTSPTTSRRRNPARP